jgi:diketogulonate reductase-like aldo/keto reductase
MTERTWQIGGVAVPTLLYGTAWKERRTANLVTQALRMGFRGLDTANQRRHYREAEVGRALLAEWQTGTLHRGDVFVQTKFTFRWGQDRRLPYDPAAPVARQVQQSFDSSLSHLGGDVVDSYLLHAPSVTQGLGRADIEAWRVMESLHDAGKVQFLGVSNFAPDQLLTLLRSARVRPTFVQNRPYASQGWDASVRAICTREGVTYQGFSILTANQHVLRSALVNDIASRHRRSAAQVILRFAVQLGMIALTGTTSPQHMADDLVTYEFELTSAEMHAIEHAGTALC